MGSLMRRDDSDGSSTKRRRTAGLNTPALGSIIASQKRTNNRMDRTQFEAADKELRRVGGTGSCLAAYEESMSREAVALEEVVERLPASADEHVRKVVKKVTDQLPVPGSSAPAAAKKAK